MIRSAFFSVGFRPFFASGILFSALALFVWAAFWQLDTQATVLTHFNTVGGFLFWHPHELIMGFALAIIMGFLLTAARNWTGLETAPPIGLFILWALWLFARWVMAYGNELPFLVILTSQIAAPLLAAVFIARPIIQKRMWRNIFAPVILLIFALFDCTLLYQVNNHGVIPSPLLHANVLLILLMISMIGGRVIPMFIANKLGIQKPNEPQSVFLTAILPLVVLMITYVLADDFSSTDRFTRIVTICCAALLFVSHTLRLITWHHKGIWKQPMLWSLWLFYAALPLGFLVLALAPILENWVHLGSIPIHILAIGGIAGLILSMVSRVSLGHTGRVIVHDKVIVGAFALLIASLLVRTLFIAVLGLSSQLIMLSALLAASSCLLIFVRFIVTWLTPRPNSK